MTSGGAPQNLAVPQGSRRTEKAQEKPLPGALESWAEAASGSQDAAGKEAGGWGGAAAQHLTALSPQDRGERAGR